ncbi:carbohydrate-binding module family 18 protein [Piromyces sp. E2]|nr:carbohydrate-binding module family 18 protein [Piromyces sp. E2]|eukprot:OUM66417.1 carbohydrate-binding module family 18 protein [Piromyces sp. E2]
MNRKINLFFILSFILTIIKFSYAENLNGEQFYIITVKDSEPKNHNKRQEISSNVESTIEEIHNLIVENIDTYDNQEKIEELVDKDNQLKKRDTDYLLDYGSSNFVYPIAKKDGERILYAYLTEELAATVKNLPNVKSCIKDVKYEPTSASYDLNKIKKDTKWKGVEVREHAPSHLSLISQGEYDPSFINEYDDNYYFPQSGGKGIDIFVFDTGFDFSHEEFSNTDERIVKCIFNVTDAKLIETNNELVCYGQDRSDHGTVCATAAAGKDSGAASKANIYGVLFNEYSYGNSIAAMDYLLRKKIMKPHRAVFNLSYMSYGESYDNHPEKYYEKDEEIEYYNIITKAGGIIFTSAGNFGIDVNDVKKDQAVYPCVLNSTICIGGIENDQGGDRDDYSSFKEIAIPYTRHLESGYGEEVDLYAPYHTIMSYIDVDGNRQTDVTVSGTSLSCPIAAGVAATIMSDKYGTTRFTKDTLVKYLKSIAQKNVLGRVEVPNYFLNNGKKEVYSKNNIYNGCGEKYNYRRCPDNLCCSADGRCGEKYEYCAKGCQIEYGSCIKF